jgi:hypothetical protein
LEAAEKRLGTSCQQKDDAQKVLTKRIGGVRVSVDHPPERRNNPFPKCLSASSSPGDGAAVNRVPDITKLPCFIDG